jgi:predicted nicotinamide N-methyase
LRARRSRWKHCSTGLLEGSLSEIDQQQKPQLPQVLSTTAGELTLEEYHLRLDGHGPWRLLHTGAILTRDDEERFLTGDQPRVPYGIVIWPAAIALAHEIVQRQSLFAGGGARVLELGAGIGLPGIVAASLGARIVQTDTQPVALHVCKMNAERNNLTSSIEHRVADWTQWNDEERYDVILGSDIIYAESMQPHLRRIFEANLAPKGTLLISDPFRKASIGLLEAMESDGWRVTMSKWTVGIVATAGPRPVGVYELTRSRSGETDLL